MTKKISALSHGIIRWLWKMITVTMRHSFFFYFGFNRRIIALQYCVGFYPMSTWINHRFTHVPSHLNIPSISSPSNPSRLLLSPGFSSLCHTANSHWLSILHMVIYVSMWLSPCISPSLSSPSSCVHMFTFNVCVSIATLQIHSSVPSF